MTLALTPQELAELPPDLAAELDALAEAEERSVAARYLLGEGASPPLLEVLQSPARKKFVRGANKIGKTYHLACEIWGWLTGTHPHQDLHRVPRHNARVLLWIPDLESSWAQDLSVALRETEPAGWLSAGCRYDDEAGYLVKGRRGIRTVNGSRLLLRSSHQDMKAAAGVWCHALVINEPPSKRLWGEIVRSASQQNAPILMAATMATDLGKPMDFEWLRLIVEEGDGSWEQHVVRLTPENVPWRDAAWIEEQISDCPPWEREQRIDAGWHQSTSDRVFQSWGRHLLFLDSEIPQVSLGVGHAWDHGEDARREIGLLYLYELEAEDPTVWLLDEYSSHGRTTTEEDAEAFVALLAVHGLSLVDVDEAFGDTNSGGKSSHSSVNVELEQHLMRAHNARRVAEGWPPLTEPPHRILPARKGPGSVSHGVWLLNQAMGRGKLRVSPRCKEFIRSAQHWRGSRGTDEDGRRKDAIDPARYGPARHWQRRSSRSGATLRIR